MVPPSHHVHSLSLSQRCDSYADCVDQSDEVSCEILRLPDGYRASSAPNPKGRRSNESDPATLLEVFLDINVISYSSVDVMEATITVDFVMVMTWSDTR